MTILFFAIIFFLIATVGLGQIFLKNEAKIPSLNTKLVTITEVKMSSDLIHQAAENINSSSKKFTEATDKLKGKDGTLPRLLNDNTV